MLCNEPGFCLALQTTGAEEAMENGGQESQLFKLVLDWARNNIDKSKPKVELLTEQVGIWHLVVVCCVIGNTVYQCELFCSMPEWSECHPCVLMKSCGQHSLSYQAPTTVNTLASCFCPPCYLFYCFIDYFHCYAVLLLSEFALQL